MRLVTFVLALSFICACGTSASASPDTETPTAVPTTTVAPPSPTPTPAITPAATIRAFPSVSEQDLVPGRYDSSPPFDLAFTFEIPDEGWNSAHIHDDFFDVMRFDGPDPVAPTSWVAWALPKNIIGTTTEAATALTPAAAAGLMADQSGVAASDTSPYTFLGRDGVALDLSATVSNTPIFGSSDGNFGLDPAYDMRLGIVDNDPGLLFVLCLTPEDAQSTGCGDSQPIIDSVAQ